MATTIEMWDKFMSSPSIECLDLFENEYKKSGKLDDLPNFVLALLDIGDWQRAKNICEKVVNESEDTIESHFIKLGIAYWSLGNVSSAIDFWKQSLDAKYTDLAGPIDGLLALWYAGRLLKDDKLVRMSLTKLKRFWKVTDYRKIVKWPGAIAIAGFLLGNVPVDDFLSKWKENNEILEHRRLCRAHFWVGMTLLGQSESKAMEHFKVAFSGNKIAILEYEYFLAKWEYARLTGENLWENNLHE